MLVEAPRRLMLLPAGPERQPDFYDDHAETDRDEGPRPFSWWDKIAERWPDGGRFPSLIFIDQSA